MKPNRLLYVPAGILFGGILALGVSAIAENSELDAGPRVFPYNGVLEFNGEKVNGNVDLEFSLTDEVDCNFTEEHDNVPVFSGRFTANIGEVAGDVPTCVFDADEVYIKVAVREADDDGVYTALAGQQRIHPVPFAYWAAEGSDFKIDGNANIGGNATIGGSASVGNSISINNNATIGNTATVDGDFAVGTETGAAVVHIEGNDNTRPVFRAQQFSIDSEEGSGLINLVGGASSNGSGGYTYHDTRGASRILMGDGELGFFVGAGSGDGQAEGDAVTFDNPLEINANGLNNPDGDLTLNDSLIVTGDTTYLTSTDDLDLETDGALVLGDTTGLNLAIDNNEIQARDNGGTNTLNIQREGGDTRIFGDLRLDGNLTADILQTDGGDAVVIPEVEGFDNSPIEEELAPSSTHFCALTHVRIGDDNDEDDSTMCEIVDTDGIWVLRGQTSANEARSSCGATCFRFR